MGVELINRITIKKDGVYLSTHSSNDDSPYTSCRIDALSKVYQQEGQKGLDREIICMLYNYAQLRGSHKSLDKYRYATHCLEAKKAEMECTEKTTKKWETLSEKDKTSRWSSPTPTYKEYVKYSENARKEMYKRIALKCDEYERNHINDKKKRIER